MKPPHLLVASILFTVGLVATPNSALAGQINATGATITWDESSLFEPAKYSCSTFKFNVALDSSIWQVTLSITNKFGDLVSGRGSNYGSGQVSLQVCSGTDLTGAKLNAEVITHDVVTSIYESPITFLPRSSQPSSSQKPATPQPAAPQKFKNCAGMNAVYPGGVSKSDIWVNKGSRLKSKPVTNAKVYEANKGLDKDKDGIVCER